MILLPCRSQLPKGATMDTQSALYVQDLDRFQRQMEDWNKELDEWKKILHPDPVERRCKDNT